MVYKFFDEKSGDIQLTHTGVGIGISENQQIANELHQPIIRKFEKWKVHSSYRDNIWGAGIVDLQLISKYNNWGRFFL